MPRSCRKLIGWFGVLGLTLGAGSTTRGAEDHGKRNEQYGPAAALAFARSYRGEVHEPAKELCYPGAVGVPFADCENIVPMSATLWTPHQLTADFTERMAKLPAAERKKGVIVLLKTERCAPKAMRACTTTTAALEKRATPLAGEFLIYGVLLKPRDRDVPAGSLKIETGADAWKNDAAGEYGFKQGPGATLAFIDPASGALFDRSNAVLLDLTDVDFEASGGATPRLHAKLAEILERLRRRTPPNTAKQNYLPAAG
jgi:hypothetical protein